VERAATAATATAAAAAHLDLPADSIRRGLLPGQLIRPFARLDVCPERVKACIPARWVKFFSYGSRPMFGQLDR
jgi:hypothetical protein